MKKLTALLIVIVAVAGGCKKPEASFTIDTENPQAGERIQFINTSQNTYTSEWNFDNGQVSNLMNPTMVFDEPGTYDVTLYAYSKSGRRSSTSTQQIVIGQADFLLDIRVDGEEVKYYEKEGTALRIVHSVEKEINPGATCFASYGSSLGDGVETYFTIRKGTLSWFNDSLAPDDDFTGFFNTGSYPYSHDAGAGIEIIYYEDGQEYTTSHSGGNQTGSTFNIVSRTVIPGPNVKVKLKIQFACRIYNTLGTSKTITGTYEGTFQNL